MLPLRAMLFRLLDILRLLFFSVRISYNVLLTQTESFFINNDNTLVDACDSTIFDALR